MSTIIKVTDVSSSVSVSDSTGGVIRVLRVRPTLGGEIVMYSFLGALSAYPTIRPDGSALQEGDYFMHTGIVPEQLAYYDGGGVWVLPHEDAEYSNVARLASELARDQSVAAKDESVVAKNESVAAKDESVTAKNESVAAKDESVTAKDDSVTAKNESVTAKLASELARDDSVTAKNESVVAKDESVVAKDEAIAAKNAASAIASVSYNRTQYNVVDLISNPSSTYALTGSNFSQGNMLVLVDRATTFNVTASIREPGAEIIIKNVHRANLTIVSDEPFTSGSTSYTVNEAGTLVIKFIELGGELALLPSFSPEPWGEGSTVIHINNDYTVQASDITVGKNLFILVDASEGEYREITLPGLTELQQEGFTISVHVFGGEAELIASPTDPNFPNEILSGTTFVGGGGEGTLHATCIGLSQVGNTSVYKANYATSLTDGPDAIEPSAPSDGNIYGLKDDKWVQVPSGTSGSAAYELTQADIDNETTTPGLVTGEKLGTLGGSGPSETTSRTKLVYTLTTGSEVVSIPASVLVDVYLFNNGIPVLQDDAILGLDGTGKVISVSVSGSSSGDTLLVYYYTTVGVVGQDSPASSAYELTDDDITNATSTSGLVTGEQLATLGGGPEILKDWTFVADANGTISLLGDLVLGASGLDKLTIEYDDLDAANATGWKGVIMVGTETAGGTIYSEIRTQAFNSLGGGDVSVISDGTYPMSPVLSYGNYPVASAKGTLEITERERTNNQIIMIYGEAQTLSSDANGNGMRHNATRYVAGVRTANTNKINNILFDTSGMGATSFRYRIIRKQ